MCVRVRVCVCVQKEKVPDPAVQAPPVLLYQQVSSDQTSMYSVKEGSYGGGGGGVHPTSPRVA